MIIFIVAPKNSGLAQYRERALSLIQGGKPRIIEVRGEDVPFWTNQFLQSGRNAVGLTGEDLYKEYILGNGNENGSSCIRILKKIEWSDSCALFSKPCLCLLGPEGKSICDLGQTSTIAISSKYKKIADEYLKDLEQKGYSFKRIYVKGCVELSCAEGIADIVIDIVYSGKSLKKNRLCVYDQIMQSDFLILGGSDD